MKKEIIFTSLAPAPIGPYSQAVRAGNLLFVSGQIAINPADGQVVSGGVEAETRQVMKNLDAILMAAGLTFDSVLKSTIFLKNMDDFPVVNKIYGESFPTDPPARETVQVARLPREVNVEISVVAAYA